MPRHSDGFTLVSEFNEQFASDEYGGSIPWHVEQSLCGLRLEV